MRNFLFAPNTVRFMRSADWKVIGSLGIILGILLLLGGLFAYFYTEIRWFFVIAPYRDMAAPLIIVGVILLVVGFVSNARAQEEQKIEAIPKTPSPIPTPSVQKRFCANCGTELSAGVKYCPNCGQKSQV